LTISQAISKLLAVARKLRLQFEGAIYHVMNRGDHHEAVFRGVADRELFLKSLGEACAKTDWQVHAWCLMSNHFHLVVETPKANLVDGMKWLLGTYTARFNRRHKVFGHLFSGRYKALFVDGSGTGYLKSACDYVHLNPVRAKLLTRRQRLREYRWSSFPEYLKAPSARPGWLRTDRLLGEHGIQKDSAAGRAEFEKRLELRRASEELEHLEELLGGWCLGSEEFREDLLAQMNERKGAEHFGVEIRESATDKARRVVKEELGRLGWSESELKRHRKGAPEKLQIALRLRKETTMTLAWIAERLQMGTKTHLSHLLYWQGRKGPC
jgi:REP element-mobilizing transposase RayT